MDSKNIKVTKEIKINVLSSSLTNFASNNTIFCDNLVYKNDMLSRSGKREVNSSPLIFDMTGTSNSDKDTLDNIIELLTQLKESQTDPNVLIQNNTLVRQQIFKELKNELVNVQNKLSSSHIQKLQILSNDFFDQNALDNLLLSLKEEAKKKSSLEVGLKSLYSRSDYTRRIVFSDRIFRDHIKFLKIFDRHKEHVSPVFRDNIPNKATKDRPLIHIIKHGDEQQKDKQYNLNIIKNKNLLNETLYKGKSFIQTINLVKETSRIYKENEILKRKFNISASGFTEYIEKDTVFRRDKFTYQIQNRGRERYNSIVDEPQTQLIKNNISKESRVIHYSRIEQNKENNLYNKSDDIYVKNIRIQSKDLINQHFIKHRLDKLNVLNNRYIKNNILKISDNLYYKITKFNTKDNFLDKSNIIFYNKNIHGKLEKYKAQSTVTTQKVSIINRNIINEENIIKHLNYKLLTNNKLRNYKKSLNNYNENKLEIFNKTLLYTNKYKVKLSKEKVLNELKINDIENNISKKTKNINVFDAINKISNKIEYTLENNKITRNKKIFIDTIYKKINNQDINETKNSIKNKFITKISNEKIEFNNNNYEKNREIEFLTDFKYRQKNIFTENINKKSIFSKLLEDNKLLKYNFYSDFFINKNKKIYTQIEKIYHKSNIKKIDMTENVTTKVNSYKENFANKTKTHYVTYLKILSEKYKETLLDKNIYKNKNIILEKARLSYINKIQPQIKQSSEDIIIKILNTINDKKIKNTVVNENKIFNIEEKIGEIIKPYILEGETLKYTRDISKFLFKKSSITLPPDIRKIKVNHINKKNIYREIKSTEKSYFNDIQESLEQKILLRDKNIVSDYSDIRQEIIESIVYKTPINVKYIKQESKKGSNNNTRYLPTKGDDNLRQNSQQSAKNGKHYNKIEKATPSLQKDDVLKMIKDYVGDIDINSISDIVLSRVGEEMELERRRNGVFQNQSIF